MRLAILSDLHLDIHFENGHTDDKLVFPIQIHPLTLKNKDVDFVVCAGDLSFSYKKYNEACDMFRDYEGKYFKKALTIRGNHDYFSYWGPLSRVVDPLEYEYNNVVFLGTTLWTPIHNNANLIEQYMTDYHNIAGWMGAGVAIQNEYYRDNVKWLCEKIYYYTKHGKDLVIVTHHLPFKELILPKYADKSFGGYFLNSAFAIVDEPSPFEEFLNYTNIKAWIVGHTHTAFEKKIGNIQFYCNPYGYKNEHDENTTYQLVDIVV